MKSMETPSSTTRRVTRSQTKAAAAAMNSPITMSISKKSEKLRSKRRKEKGADGSSTTALIDITNNIGSPIVGVAMGILKTPSSSSSLAKKKKVPILTPCSGESLLRRQVKALLKKNPLVIQEDDEEAADDDEVLSKFSFGHHHHPPSPASRVFLAPTPANTPHHLFATINGDIKVNAVMNSFLPSSIIKPTELVEEDHLRVTQGKMVIRMEDGSNQGGGSSTLELQKKKKKSSISRSLLFEFSSEKSESTSDDDDDHFSKGGGGLIDELCEGVRKISTTTVNKNNEKTIPAGGFVGKHIRFVYSSSEDEDDERD